MSAPRPRILARGPWAAEQVTARWLEETYEPPDEVASAYARLGLAEHAVLPSSADGVRHIYHLYVVRSERELPLGRGYYRVPVHRQPAIGRDADLPATEEAARTNYALPMGTDLTEAQLREVVAACASGST